MNGFTEEINLSCSGPVEVDSITTGKKNTTQSNAFLKIDTLTNLFSIDGYSLMSTTLDPNLNSNSYRFVSTDSDFDFFLSL